jgi:HEAT repeat protein
MKRIFLIFAMVLSLLLVSTPAMAGKGVDKLKGSPQGFEAYAAAFEEILAEGYAAVPELIALVQSSVATQAKVTAINALGELQAKDALAVLGSLMANSGDLSVIYNAARAIGNTGGNQAYKILADLLENADTAGYPEAASVKKAAILGLGLLGDKKAVKPLLAVLNDLNNDDITRIYAAGSLGLLGNASGLGLVQDSLNSDDPAVRTAAIRALGAIGDASSINALASLAAPGNQYGVRGAATAALAQVKAANMGKGERVGFIKKQLEETPQASELVAWGLRELKKNGTPQAMAALKELAGKQGPEFAALVRAAKIKAGK